MRGLESTSDLMARSGLGRHIVKWMWRHGFDPAALLPGKREGTMVKYWRTADFDLMVEERLRWGFFERGRDGEIVVVVGEKDRIGMRGEDPVPPISLSARPVRARGGVGLDPAKIARERASRATRRAQLESAPVSVKDLDYLATRAGERRRSGNTVGTTEVIMAKAKHGGG